MSNHLTLRDFRTFLEARAKEYDSLLRWVESHTGWLAPHELEDACLKSELWHSEREHYLHAIAMLNEFEKLKAEA